MRSRASAARVATLIGTLRSMRRPDGTLRTLATLTIAFLVNALLDVAFDLPMLVRWSIAVTVVLVLVAVLDARRRRAGAPST